MIRRLLAQRYVAVLICVAALALKLVVPTGYMIGDERGHVAIVMCPGAAAVPVAAAMHGVMADHGKSKDHGKPELPCAFAGLSAASLGAVDSVLLAALIVFVMAVGLSRALPLPWIRRSYLRPPLRGPPAVL